MANYVDALIIVDVQNDFCPPDGKLAVPRGDTIIPTLVKYIEAAFAAHIPVYASRDWHPATHNHHHTVHFDIWPEHCVQGTRGAEFHPGIARYIPAMQIITKGDNMTDDGYSAFEGRLDVNGGVSNGPTLGEDLKRRGVTRVFVGGLATDYCVKATVLDALDPSRAHRRKDHEHPLTPEQAAHAPGVAVVWLSDASLPVEAQQGDGDAAETEMLKAGAVAITIEQFAPTPGTEPDRLVAGKNRR